MKKFESRHDDYLVVIQICSRGVFSPQAGLDESIVSKPGESKHGLSVIKIKAFRDSFSLLLFAGFVISVKPQTNPAQKQTQHSCESNRCAALDF